MRRNYSKTSEGADLKVPFQFISVNGSKNASLQTDAELRDIKEILSGRIQPFVETAAHVLNLVAALRENKPKVVHFSGHGNNLGELMFLDKDDKPYPADKAAIQEIFWLHRGSVRLVVLSACCSAAQAELLASHVDTVIGFPRPVDDDIASRYAYALYRLLRGGEEEEVEVAAAHESALSVVRAERGGFRDGPEPLIYSRAKGRRAVIFPVLNDQLEQQQNLRRGGFVKTATWGVSMGSFTLTKLNQERDGFSTLLYEVKGLKVTGTSPLAGIVFRLDTAAGQIYGPVFDKKTSKRLYWRPALSEKPKTFQEVIDRARSINGVLQFRERLEAGKGPYHFSWSVKVYNMDAFTRWEFENLYPHSAAREHVDGSPLEPPAEYIARLVWLPQERLTLRVQLPPGSPELRFRCFEWIGEQIRPENIVNKELLLSAPSQGLTVHGEGRLWEERSEAAELESELLFLETDGFSIIDIPHPTLGTYYSLDWQVVEEELRGETDRLAAEATSIRSRLLEHRGARLALRQSHYSAEIDRLAKELHVLLRRYFPKLEGELLQSTLFSLDRDTSQVVACESFTGEGEPTDVSQLLFSLPFGMGLAGACFRSGTGFLTYNRSLYPKDDQPEIYLPSPGAPPHAYLLAIPIDHYDFNTSTPPMERSRQLVGVVTVSSNDQASRLRRFCVAPQGQTEEDKLSRFNEMGEFRKECQSIMNSLSRYLLR
jgi:CHAT domain